MTVAVSEKLQDPFTIKIPQNRNRYKLPQHNKSHIWKTRWIAYSVMKGIKACSQRSEIGTSKEVFPFATAKKKKKSTLGINVTKGDRLSQQKTIKHKKEGKKQ